MSPSKINIMVVDDHQIFIDGISLLLSNEKNISVYAHANNGKEALSILEKGSVDIVLIDIEMPVLNGYDTTAIITTKYPNTKVICLTTHDEKSIVQKMLNAGATGYLLKNIDKETLIKAINSVINGLSFFSSEIPIALESSESTLNFKTEKQPNNINTLSAREVEILTLIANGLSNNEIADKLSLSPKTIESHRTNIMQKLNVHNVVGLVKFAIKSGLVI
ncbi:MAG: response regulator transcription factor [Bacteroidota bacterium]|nr:response regulator transcription factor [Bacteroidota bacterium]